MSSCVGVCVCVHACVRVCERGCVRTCVCVRACVRKRGRGQRVGDTANRIKVSCDIKHRAVNFDFLK